ncbi:MAG: gliding motility-associated C-terminal domain-containing protein [Saprospiraceae bacterium]
MHKLKISFFYLILVGIISPISLIAQSNEGTDFWFVFLQHHDKTNDKKCIISSKYSTSGYIEIPAINWKQDFTVQANNVFIIDVPAESEMIGSEQISNNGVHVVTEMPSSVYIHQYFTFRADAALVLPVPSLGLQYYVMTYHGYEDDGKNQYPSEFAIVGVEDFTTIKINYSASTLNGKKKGDVETITLNKGQAYQVQGSNSNNDLTGTYVESDKYIALFSGNRWTQIPNGVGNRDNLLEQMYPIEVWGKQFVAVPSKNSAADRYRILASEDNTTVGLFGKGNLPGPFILMKGEWKEFELNAVAAFIQSNKPIMVAMFLVGADYNGMNNKKGDPSMVLLNSVEQYRDTVTLYNSPFKNITENFINLITSTKDTAGLHVDGKTIAELNETFQFIGPMNEFAYVQLKVNSGAHLLLSEACGLIAIAYGYGEAESYAYGGGANFTKLNKLPIPDGSCLNDSILFKSGLPPKKYDVFWDLGDKTTSRLHTFSHTYKSLGEYNVKLIIHDLCRNQYDSIQKVIKITLRENLIAYPDTLVCEGSEVEFYALDRIESTYAWQGPNNFTSDKQKVILKNLKSNQSGNYIVTGIYFGCPTYPISLNLIVKDNPKLSLGKDTFFCPSKTSLTLQIPNFNTILWEDNSTGTTHIIREEGSYSVKVIDENDCQSSDTILVADKCPLIYFIPNVFSPNGDGINDDFVISISKVKSFRMEIFSRWGERMYSTEDTKMGWNGKLSNGEPAIPGVYVYLIHAEGYNEKGESIIENITGDLTLLR